MKIRPVIRAFPYRRTERQKNGEAERERERQTDRQRDRRGEDYNRFSQFCESSIETWCLNVSHKFIWYIGSTALHILNSKISGGEPLASGVGRFKIWKRSPVIHWVELWIKNRINREVFWGEFCFLKLPKVQLQFVGRPGFILVTIAGTPFCLFSYKYSVIYFTIVGYFPFT
jgi:hypothetical protein